MQLVNLCPNDYSRDVVNVRLGTSWLSSYCVHPCKVKLTAF